MMGFSKQLLSILTVLVEFEIDTDRRLDMWSDEDRKYMTRAMALAAKGEGFVNPNPLVGAVIVREGRIIGEGWHHRYGMAHAERDALAACTENPEGATMYVTLEPCCHYGKQPPCTDAIMASGISEVIVGLTDPNPKVAGKGIEILRNAGIEVRTGLMEDEIRKQNRVFLKYIQQKRPWVVLKSAMTLDGRIASRTGDSKWVTGEEARQFVQKLRSRCMGIMAGRGTVEADNPMLNCRIDGMRSPVRILPDSMASLALDSNIVKTAGQYKTILFHLADAPADKLAALGAAGVETVECRGVAGGGGMAVDPEDMLDRLGAAGIDSLLLEGGGELNWSFVSKELVDEYYLFYAPKIIGGRNAVAAVAGNGFGKMGDAAELRVDSVQMIGKDILVHAYTRIERICLQE